MGRLADKFLHRIELWGEDDSTTEEVASVEDFLLAMATYHAACRRWPQARITLRQRGKVIEDSRLDRPA
jgi:hypothetical protein